MKITREKALKKIYFLYEDGFCKEDLGILINKIYDSFEEREIFLTTKNTLCDGCKHHLSQDGNYPLEPCGECERWYSDMYEKKDSE